VLSALVEPASLSDGVFLLANDLKQLKTDKDLDEKAALKKRD